MTNVVLIALDTQRADHLGCYGYHRDTSPNLDALAAEGVVFERCYAPNIPTHPSFTTLFSGKEAITHDIVNIGGKVPVRDGIRLLPEILTDHGYATAAVDNMGRHFTRGFEQYHHYQWDRSDPTVLRKAETVTELALPLIDDLQRGSRPFFLFLHYWDPHTPYLPPPGYESLYQPANADPYDPHNHSMDEAWSWEPFKWYFHDWMPGVTDAEYVVNLYDGEVKYMDHHLARVFKALEPVREDTIVVITADHGEVLNEQLGYFDHHGLYEGNVHIPLIITWPGTLPAGRRVPGLVQNVDVAQTLLDLLGIRQSEGMEGLSLLPTIYGARDSNYSEVPLSEATWQVKRGIRTDRWKFIRSIEPDPHGRPMKELFDLAADPGEQHNVVDAHPDVAADLERRLDAWLARRLEETGRDTDPVAEQGACASQIGTPQPDERVGPGATPLRARIAGANGSRDSAAGIPDPSELNARGPTR
ncbi:sulfatase [Actinopolymorpha alba]|uniref:sulfatase family protein n=1 Tax=Actinopolymorpha alba TaxID=533267 RepID=UPI0003750F15|nr:sulfatase [Actinopolymorpha alba]